MGYGSFSASLTAILGVKDARDGQQRPLSRRLENHVQDRLRHSYCPANRADIDGL